MNKKSNGYSIFVQLKNEIDNKIIHVQTNCNRNGWSILFIVYTPTAISQRRFQNSPKTEKLSAAWKIVCNWNALDHAIRHNFDRSKCQSVYENYIKCSHLVFTLLTWFNQWMNDKQRRKCIGNYLPLALTQIIIFFCSMHGVHNEKTSIHIIDSIHSVRFIFFIH